MQKWGMQEAEFSWVLESNTLSRASLEKGGAKLDKTYRMYDYEIQYGPAHSHLSGDECERRIGRDAFYIALVSPREKPSTGGVSRAAASLSFVSSPRLLTFDPKIGCHGIARQPGRSSEAVWPHLFAATYVLLMVIASAHLVMYKKDTRAAIGWIGVVVMVPIFGGMLYAVFGINRLQRRR